MRTLTEEQLKKFGAAVKYAVSAYEEIDVELRKRVAQYLIDESDPSCLLDLHAALQSTGRKAFFRQTSGGGTRGVDRIELGRFRKLVEFEETPAGYYRRLGEVAGRIPEVSQSRFEFDDRMVSWLRDYLGLRDILSNNSYSYYSRNVVAGFFLQPVLEDLEDAEQVQLVISLVVNAQTTSWMHISRVMLVAADWPAILSARSDMLAESLRLAPAAGKETAVAWLISMKYDFATVLPLIAEMSVGTSKKVRGLTVGVLREYPEQASELLRNYLTGSSASERGFAAEALVTVLGTGAEADLKKALKNEKGQRTKATLESLLTTIASAGTATASQGEAIDIELPPVDIPLGEVALPPGFSEAFRSQLNSAFDGLDRQYEKQMEAYQKPGRPSWMRVPDKPERTNDQDFEKIIAFIEGRTDRANISNWTKSALHAMTVWSQWTDLTKIELVHVVRLMKLAGFVQQYGNDAINSVREDWLESHRAAQSKRYGLRELDHAFSSVAPLKKGVVANAYLQMNNAWRQVFNWEPEAVWPLFVECSGTFRDAVLGISKERNDYWIGERRRTAMQVASMMPKLLPEIESTLWSVALGEAKTDRPAARRALQSAGNWLERGLSALADGRQGVRIAAAELLAELNDPAAVEPLKKALRKEKQEIVKGSLLQAIELLGGDVEEFLGRKKQLLDAKKGLEKKRPKGMEWIVLDTLPTIHWDEDGKPVAAEIVQWWVVQSVQFKLPAPGAILRKAIGMCRPADVATLARHILAQWIAYDTKTASREEAMAQATKQASQQWNNKHADWLRNYFKTEENYRKSIFDQIMGTCIQSAIGQKGLLAIVAAGGDSQCVKSIERYIRTYHGHRLAQSKALLELLPWIEESTAIQVLLSLANRFRTNAIRKRAAELVQELADRQGWTMDQLADRTIPDAGFTREVDESGVTVGDRAELVLDYGPRKFRVILDDDLQPVISREDGKSVKALPAPAKDDDPELAKVAKSEFSAAKKTVKEVVKLQAERLYEAVCAQRSWPAADWQRYLAQHPIAGALCRRVVWAAKAPGDASPLRLFRPLEDGTLTDVNDDEFVLEDDDEIVVAHASLLDPDSADAWKQHLLDYEVPELFKQFGRESYRLPTELRGKTDVVDFQGHMLTTFRLRSKGNKLGWQRGDAEDGGAFCIYRKPFRSKEIEAIIEFTGSYLPEEDIAAGLRALYFQPLRPNGDSEGYWNPTKLKLEKVPPVLLSECYNDMREIAAEGSGFDPDWEKKGLW